MILTTNTQFLSYNIINNDAERVEIANLNGQN